MTEPIVCKPTPWFLLRAVAMLLMFGIFAVMFFVDGKWGYREKNLSYYLAEAFEKATNDFKLKQDEMSPERWRSYAERQQVPFPEDPELLPEGTQVPMIWPVVLHDYDTMKSSLGQPMNKLFDDYRLEAGIRKDVPEHDFPKHKITEQWVAFGVCLVLTVGAAVVLLRTIGRSMSVDGEAFHPAGGGSIPFGDLVRLDLRKWDTKGLAYAWAKTAAGAERKVKIDGLTYGGFKKEQDEPAERLMQRLRGNFSGEIIEYVTEAESAGGNDSPAA
ncbi:hypothetical protein [Luteolibacter marinus]|uniref:hypothetical protein n=1 Tax=Luteolibacter marinus TaxID=2776705 RepID=UPI001866C4DC|nr:hypothetical protein [Luteolibacter marinus]